jgi:hypothetical protein
MRKKETTAIRELTKREFEFEQAFDSTINNVAVLRFCLQLRADELYEGKRHPTHLDFNPYEITKDLVEICVVLASHPERITTDPEASQEFKRMLGKAHSSLTQLEETPRDARLSSNSRSESCR